MSNVTMKFFLKSGIHKQNIKSFSNQHCRKLKTTAKFHNTYVSYVQTRAVGILKPQLK